MIKTHWAGCPALNAANFVRCPSFECGAASHNSRAKRVRRGKPQQPCKKCYLEYGRRHYQNNKQYYVDKAKRYNDTHWERTQRLLWAYLHEHPCVDCGNSDPRVLEFDHVRGEKTHNVSDLKSLRFGWEAILREIEKCEVRCANCHRIKTYGQFLWRTYDENI